MRFFPSSYPRLFNRSFPRKTNSQSFPPRPHLLRKFLPDLAHVGRQSKMVKNTFSLVTLFLSVLVAPAAASRGGSCGRKCRFTFCGGSLGPFELDSNNNDKAFTPEVGDKRGKIIVGYVDRPGEARIVNGRKAIRISSYKPRGLRQSYSPSVFKAANISKKAFRSGISHEVFQQNQIGFLNNKCIIVPLGKYQVLDRHGNVIDNVNSRRALVDCVAFKTRVH